MAQREVARLHQSPGSEPTRPRWPAIDVARGVAIAAMVVYHFAWDLSFVRLIATDIVGHPAWQLFARTIAASFLVLVGIGLALGHGDGVRWRSYLRRLAVITGAALAITLVTRFAFPDEYIFFGILHCIALSSLLALPFLRAPTAVLAVAAAFCFAAPFLFTAPALDEPYLDWLGLGSSAPVTNDYVPVFPWFGWVLVGLAGGPRDPALGGCAACRGRTSVSSPRAGADLERPAQPRHLPRPPTALPRGADPPRPGDRPEPEGRGGRLPAGLRGDLHRQRSGGASVQHRLRLRRRALEKRRLVAAGPVRKHGYGRAGAPVGDHRAMLPLATASEAKGDGGPLSSSVTRMTRGQHEPPLCV